MLILTRKRSETIQIGDNVTIKVIRTGKGSVKLGITAPEDVRVLRGELSPEETTQPEKREGNRLIEMRRRTTPAAMGAGRDELARPYLA